MKCLEETLIETHKKVGSKAKMLSLLEKSLKDSLEATLNSDKRLNEYLFTLKDELVDTYDHYF